MFYQNSIGLSNYTPKNMTQYSDLSLCSVPIEMIFSETDKCISTATAFFYNYEDNPYLITNWHNITGLNPATKKPLSEHAGIPDLIKFPLIERQKDSIFRPHVTIQLYKDDGRCKPYWFIHPSLKEKVDVVAIPLVVSEGLESSPINDPKNNLEDFEPSVADDVYILGYPYNIRQAGEFPIWKRASIASEPSFDYSEKPIILVDTATRSGMSGSPAILKRNGIWHNPALSIGTKQCFLGVYSGRLIGETEFEAQLGIIWKKHLIEEIIQGAQCDNYHWGASK